MAEGRMRGRSRGIQQVARVMRREATPAEAALWHSLRRQQVCGLQFRRQHALDRFVLDFYCPARRLCVELDGAVHDDEGQRERDGARTALLEARGIRVLRFRNEEVLGALPVVLAAIRDAACSPAP